MRERNATSRRRSLRCFAKWATLGGVAVAAGAGGWYGWNARDRWPVWPGGQAAWYDEQQAAGFPTAKAYMVPGYLTSAAAPLGVMRGLDRADVGVFLDGESLGYELFEDGPMPLGGQTLEGIADDFSLRTGIAFEPVLVTDFLPDYFNPRGGGASLQPKRGDGFIAILSANAASPRREVILGFGDGDGYWRVVVDDRGGIFASAMAKVGWDLPLPSRAVAVPEVVAENLRRHAGDTAAVENASGDRANLQLLITSGAYAEITLTADSRGIAAISDRLRTLVIYEIAADTAFVGIASGLLAAPIFGFVAVFARSRIRRRRIRAGHCVECDYDLRHAPGTCPECGHAMAFG